MSIIIEPKSDERHLVMGNEAIARGALEAGVAVVAGYPGTPSSEIVESLASVSKERNLYVEWSTNEKVAMEVAAAGSFANLRSLCVLKQNGVNVASDFFLHLAGSGTRGGMVILPCEDPGALSSVNEGDSRHFSRMLEIPLLEPGDFQEAKDMTKWGFELSETLKCPVLVRSVTRLSHASGTVTFGDLPTTEQQATFKHDGFVLDPETGPVISAPVNYKHGLQQQKVQQAMEMFEASPFNTYSGPDNPELIIITSSACNLYSREAIKQLGLRDRVGILKLGTTWPLPPRLLEKHLRTTNKVLIVEEVIPFLEESVKILGMELAEEIGIKKFYGKRDGSIPSTGELNPDIIIVALCNILEMDYVGLPAEYEEKAVTHLFLGAPAREGTFCAGCPHRASFWNISLALKMDNNEGFVCGDIGCYTMAVRSAGFSTLKTLHAMGSGTGVASGFGKLGQFGMDQPVFSVCGDSTFYHAVMPALVNAVHHKSDITLVVLDNSGTAMTGFQPHPGTETDVRGEEAVQMDIESICKSIGATVFTADPFDFKTTQETLHNLMKMKGGVKVLVLRQICALSPEKKGTRWFDMSVTESKCLGESCGCNRLCTRVFSCPGLVWDPVKKVSKIDDVICIGCGVCSDVCPVGAIDKKELT
ncbi:MAG: 4Fe-4S binding protein [Deltaproteobacteria bacterium]|nr:4Fe-4S binding protein [Deltaproteobacteria bacterium]MBT7155790.1 4Fe-4S binding protein [Deltaproteobacteria bacterium]